MNKIFCSICDSENFILNLKCSNCGSLIRENIRTINIGETFQNFLLNTDFGIKKVLYSEKKNYLLLLISLLSIKLTILTFFDISILDQKLITTLLKLNLLVFSYWFLFILLLGVIFKVLIEIIVRNKFYYKDSLTIIAFSFLYFSVVGIILFLLELMLFGKFFFSNNPSIFQINLYKALAVISLEMIIFLYSLFLLIRFLVFILHKKFLATLLSVAFLIFIFIGNEILKKHFRGLLKW